MKQYRKGAGSFVLLLCFLTTLLLSGCRTVSGAVRDTDGSAKVTTYYSYGTFFQLAGMVSAKANGDLPLKDIRQAALVLRSGAGDEDVVYRADVPFSLSGKKGQLRFHTSDKLDTGLCLDTLPTGTCAALLELTDKSGGVRRLVLRDGTGTDGSASPLLDYYTLPGHHGRRHVTAEFEPAGETETLVFRVKRARLPSDVYDIVVDPGHGGKDPGAQAGNVREADVVLDLGKRLADTLDQAGYKVLLTRDGTEDPNVNMAYTEYDKDGRVNRTAASRAKLCLSLHLNQNKNGGQNGVQIYKAKRADDAFASYLADTLVSRTDLAYSGMGGRTRNGVYVRTFTGGELAQERAKARRSGYTFYDATTATDFFFMIREYGCYATGAYVDGRNPKYGVNEYRDFRQGVESCLCELGFLSNEHDRTILQNDQRSIARALTAAVDAYVDSLYAEGESPSADLLAKETT